MFWKWRSDSQCTYYTHVVFALLFPYSFKSKGSVWSLQSTIRHFYSVLAHGNVLACVCFTPSSHSADFIVAAFIMGQMNLI